MFAIYGWAFGLIGFVSSYAVVLPGALVSGLGVGLFFPNSYLWLLSLAPPRLRGRLSGGLTTAVFIGQFFSPLLAQPLIAATSLSGALVITAGLAAVVAASPVALRRLRAGGRA